MHFHILVFINSPFLLLHVDTLFPRPSGLSKAVKAADSARKLKKKKTCEYFVFFKLLFHNIFYPFSHLNVSAIQPPSLSQSEPTGIPRQSVLLQKELQV